ncbi:MAG: S-adenosyl-L-methionine-dependent methyltransferase [Olpidium bornovanus]|uniref:S-adenosyl-L-methionine-dependent methyltransferase n=1 Tax=Olpidium bornovanus TaxID=278681 RepID=A0A8H7ZRY5_9FUNG|nr:MAG: S-adenosyl-L-methionine-dependent methyltransferase [Olpidium bornovanus]
MNFYKQASSILDCVAARKGTVKSLTLADGVKDKKRMYALVRKLETNAGEISRTKVAQGIQGVQVDDSIGCDWKPFRLDKNTIAELIDKSKILQAEKKLTHSLALVLIHDLLFRARGLQLSDGPLKQSVLRHKARLSAELTRIKIRAGVKAVGDLVPECQKKHVRIPRYARVNTLKISIDDALKKLRDDGFVLEDEVEKPDNLAAIADRTSSRRSPLFIERPFLQDKASCFPAHVLFSDPFLDPDNPPDVIDACAAPGNKTTHAAALMNDRGKLWAFDLDAKRLGTLKQMLAKAGCKGE